MSTLHDQQPFAQPGPVHGQQQQWPPPDQSQSQPPPPPAQPQYQPAPQYQLAPQYQPAPQPQLSRPAKRGNALAIVALVVASLSLLLVLGLIVFVVASGFFSPPGDLQGTAPQVVAGQPYQGTLLAGELSRVITADFGEVASMTCPETPVDADVVVSCHGVVDGFDSKVEVTFEDKLGHFTLVEG